MYDWIATADSADSSAAICRLPSNSTNALPPTAEVCVPCSTSGRVSASRLFSRCAMLVSLPMIDLYSLRRSVTTSCSTTCDSMTRFFDRICRCDASTSGTRAAAMSTNASFGETPSTCACSLAIFRNCRIARSWAMVPSNWARSPERTSPSFIAVNRSYSAASACC